MTRNACQGVLVYWRAEKIPCNLIQIIAGVGILIAIEPRALEHSPSFYFT